MNPAEPDRSPVAGQVLGLGQPHHVVGDLRSASRL